MNRPEVYQKSVDLLFHSYFNDTLRHSRCTACAVSNILKPTAGALSIPVHRWANLFMTKTLANGSMIQMIVKRQGEIIARSLSGDFYLKDDEDTAKEALLLVNASGYNTAELAKVEYAFETAPQGNSAEDWMFNGLEAVLEVLKQIHEVEDEELVTINHKRFESHYKTKQLA